MVNGRSFEEIMVGEKASFGKTISESDIYAFAGITGDFNPLHINEVFAAKSLFKKRIAHGMLSASLISTVLGTDLPGPDTIYLSQEIQFKAPVFIGDTLTVEVEVLEKNEEKRIIILKTKVSNQDGKTVVDGQAKTMKK
jgi:3-hydroxybutyryl-CoA dehydratase